MTKHHYSHSPSVRPCAANAGPAAEGRELKTKRTQEKVNQMKLTSLFLAFSLSAVAAQAEVQSYECDLHSTQDRGCISRKVLLSVDADGKRARAYDGAIRASNELASTPVETPADAKFKKTGKGEYRLSWRVTLPAQATGDYRVAYTATLNPKNNAIKMRVSFPHANVGLRPYGTGTCKPIASAGLY
ncbi:MULTISPECIES: hypothetical protein [unclassified Ruegeria]|uniref:hypothetical protein n=1 Tax=unclassified Ruegeria TaxID=2625375 RepID=UPI001AE1E870|nr:MULTISPECIES: hypothetical protein [unclassified Ruegeria]